MIFVIQRFGTKLCLLDEDSRQQYSKKFQYSLRSIFGLTFGVAILFSSIGSYRVYHWEILSVVTMGLATIGIALATIWAVLGQGWPLPRIVVVSLVAIGLGLISTFAIEKAYLSLSFISALQVFLIMLPLLVVRSMGYRVVNNPEHITTPI